MFPTPDANRIAVTGVVDLNVYPRLVVITPPDWLSDANFPFHPVFVDPPGFIISMHPCRPWFAAFARVYPARSNVPEFDDVAAFPFAPPTSDRAIPYIPLAEYDGPAPVPISPRT